MTTVYRNRQHIIGIISMTEIKKTTRSTILECNIKGERCLKKYIQTRKLQHACPSCQDIEGLEPLIKGRKYIYKDLAEI